MFRIRCLLIGAVLMFSQLRDPKHPGKIEDKWLEMVLKYVDRGELRASNRDLSLRFAFVCRFAARRSHHRSKACEAQSFVIECECVTVNDS